MSLLRKLYNKLRWHAAPVIMRQNGAYANYDVGEWSYGKPKIIAFEDRSFLRIGKFCSFSDDVTILLGGEHNLTWISTYPFSEFFASAQAYPGHPRSKGNIVIGHDVWVGTGAIILSGVSIGNGAVIGARSVVTSDVPPYSITAGNPARHLRYRFPQDVRDRLEALAWWDWPREKIEQAIPLLMSGNIDQFFSTYG